MTVSRNSQISSGESRPYKPKKAMKTLSFIGSDKNAGKTTILNFVYRKLQENTKGKTSICLASIGINGEDIDFYENQPKPTVSLCKGSCFITAGEHLQEVTGKYKMLHNFTNPDFKKIYVLGECLFDFQIILEGPNNKHEILRMKRKVEELLPQSYLLIDGSIDRQFLAHPAISDAFYFVVLISTRKEQFQKAKDLLFSLSLHTCSKKQNDFLKNSLEEDTKSLLFRENNQVLYCGKKIPFLDMKLKKMCIKYKNRKYSIYLNGALSKSLFTFLAPLKNLTIILDNFTLYQNISVHNNHGIIFRPKLLLLYPVKVQRIFLKQETSQYSLPLPENIPVHNLFREDIHEIRI